MPSRFANPPRRGAAPVEKPEELTNLTAHRLVPKDHPRIRFRGQMDLLQAHIVTAQVALSAQGGSEALVAELEGVLTLLRQMVRSEVLDEPLPSGDILGLTPQELRAQSHDPKTYFGVEPMTPPSYRMGQPYALVNLLRTQARVTEEVAVAAFYPRPTPAQRQILKTLNRLSSAFHILMCRLQAGRYRDS